MASNPDYLAQRLTWGSTSHFTMVLTAATLSLGHVFMFPYLAKQYGLSAFSLIYLCAVLVIGLPAMLAELLLGRRGHQNAVSTVRLLALEVNRSTAWQVFPWIGCLLLLFGIVSYSIVGGWSLSTVFDHLLQSKPTPWVRSGWFSVFFLFCFYQISLGLRRGIVRLSYISVIVIFVILLGLFGYHTLRSLPTDTLKLMVNLDFSKMTLEGIAAILLTAIQSLGVGTGVLMVYGSYAPREIKLGSTVGFTILFHLILFLIILLIVYPGMSVHSQITPEVFGQYFSPPWVGVLFFIAVIFAVMTTTVSMIEPLVILIIEKYNMTRLPALCIIGTSAWVIGVVTIFLFEPYQAFKYSSFPQQALIPLVSFGFTVFAGWFMQKRLSLSELSFRANCCYWLWLILLRFVVPFGLVLSLWKSLN